MYQLIVFLPLVGFLIAAAITLATSRPEGGRGHAPAHGHGEDDQAERHGHAVAGEEPAASHTDDHGHDHAHGHGDTSSARAAQWITTGALALSALLSWIAFFQVGFGDGETLHISVLAWIHSGDLVADWTLRIDTLTAVMLVVVTTVSTLVHLYSIGYMAHDEHPARFFSYLSLFTFAMLMLVTADNLVQMFFGWEGVGLASYLLIGFWYKRPSANAAAIKAFVVNRVGDFGFVLGIAAIFFTFHSVDLTEIFANAASAVGTTVPWLGGVDTLTLITLLLFMGAMGKSAQFLLHTWLPDAMEGPTPVSALIHAATMVTAGVFMVTRMSPLFELAPDTLAFVTFIGATTAIFAASVGLVQNDIKRVIAYSTCSQLGYMFVAIGVGAYPVAIFHLFTHAFFKALLFLGAGSVIHAVGGEQDMRRMGGLRRAIPVTYWMMIIGTLALTGLGIPYVIGMAGFHSKDAVIEAAFAGHNYFSGYAFYLIVVAALMTSFYSWRLIFLTFHGRPRASADVMAHVHESPPVMMVPLYVLAAGAVAAGFAFSYAFIGDGYHDFWGSSIFLAESNHVMHDMHYVPWLVRVLPFIMMVSGFALAWMFYIRSPETPKRLAGEQDALYKFLLNKWYFDEIYDFLFVRPAKWLGRFLWKRGDGWLIDGFGPDGVARRVADITRSVVRLQSGYLYHYAFAMLIGIAVLVTWMMLAGGGG